MLTWYLPNSESMRFPVLLLSALPSCLSAQVFDHTIQTTRFSTYTSTALANNGNWFFAGIHQQGTWSFPGILREVDQDGHVIGEWQVGQPLDGTVTIKDMIAQDNGSLLLIGHVSICDVWDPVGLIYSFDNGEISLMHSYPSMGFMDAARNDSLMVMAANTGILFADHSGDSLYWTSFPTSIPVNRVLPTEQGFVGFGSQGCRAVLTNGTLYGPGLDVPLRDMIVLEDGRLLALTMDSLLELTPGLIRTGNGLRIIDYDGPRRLAYAGDAVRVHTKDTLFSFTPQLEPISAYPTRHPLIAYDWLESTGYSPIDVVFTDELVMTAGFYGAGFSATACRSFPLDALPDEIATDVELYGLSVDSIHISTSYSPTLISYVAGTAKVSAWLRNDGGIPVTSISLNHKLIATCGANGFSQSYDTLNLAPGDSIQLQFGPFGFYQPFLQASISEEFDLCIWAAQPSYRVDRNPLDNEACFPITIDFSTGQFELIRPEQILVYPNPASSFVMIDLEAAGSVRLALTDTQGRCVHQVTTEFGGSALPIDISSLSPGTYILEVVKNDHRSTHRLVVE